MPRFLVGLLLLSAAFFVVGCQNPNATPTTVVSERIQVTQGTVVATVNATGYVEPNDSVPVSFLAQGRVAEVLVSEGERVEADQVLARLDSADADLAVRAAEAQLASATAQLAALKAAASASDVAAAEAQLTGAQAARDALPNAATDAQVAAADAQVAQAQAQLDRLTTGASSAQLAAAEAQVDQAQIGVEQAKMQRDRAELRAPIAGDVASLTLRAGAMPSPSQPALILVDLSAFKIQVAVDEVDIASINEGDTATVQVEALPDTPIQGTVERIAPVATVTQGIVTYTVTIMLDTPDASTLKPGMSATVDIVTESRDGVLLVPSRAISVDRDTGELYVEREVDGNPVRTPVTVGLRDSEHSEILSGVEEGQTLIIRSGD